MKIFLAFFHDSFTVFLSKFSILTKDLLYYLFSKEGRGSQLPSLQEGSVFFFITQFIPTLIVAL
jgi:hypothetical protein